MSDQERRHLEQLERELAPLLVGPTCSPDADGHCATCSDEARPALVLSLDETTGLALVALDQITLEVDITLVDDVVPGMVLLIHGGVAIGNLGLAKHVLSAGD